jgi:Fe-S oxidoreductase
MWMEEKIGKHINIARTEQALATNAGVVASSCPFCMTMLTDGLKSQELENEIKQMDVAELLAQSCLGDEATAPVAEAAE